MSINHRNKYRPRKNRRDRDGESAKPQKTVDAWSLAKQMEQAQERNDWKEYYRLRDILYSTMP